MSTLLDSTAARLHLRLFPRLRTSLLSFLLFRVFQRYSSTKTGKLASHGFASMAAMSSFPPQRYHYFLVLDFEATCDKPQIHPQVIIWLQLVFLFMKWWDRKTFAFCSVLPRISSEGWRSFPFYKWIRYLRDQHDSRESVAFCFLQRPLVFSLAN